MALETLFTSNFQIQYDTAEFTGAGELPLVQKRAAAFQIGCEPDYAVLCGWFGVAVGAGLGPSNRVIVTLTKTVRGAVNFGYSTHNPKMSVNPNLGASDDSVLGLFVAEMIEILMSYTGPWVASNSGGEGLSRVAAQLLHPQFGNGFVNAWLPWDPTKDPTSAVDDSEFRKDWVSKNFTGGPLKAGGSVRGDDDSYSYGCAMLFIYYLKSQLGYSMPQIVQNGGATLADTYRKLTGGQTNAFWAFKSLLAEHFPMGVQSPTDDPFPLFSQQHIFYRGADNNINHIWWDGVTGTPLHHDQWSSGAGAPTAVGDPVTMVTPGQQHIFYRGADNNINHIWWDEVTGTPLHHDQWSSGAGAPAAAGDPATMVTI